MNRRGRGEKEGEAMEGGKCETACGKPPAMIQPVIGRTLYYYPTELEGLAGYGGPLAAKIVAVHGPNMVNLVVWDANGNGHGRASVEIVSHEYKGEGVARWMPFSIAQAALRELSGKRCKVEGARLEELRDKVRSAAASSFELKTDPQAACGGAPNLAEVVPDPNAPAVSVRADSEKLSAAMRKAAEEVGAAVGAAVEAARPEPVAPAAAEAPKSSGWLKPKPKG